MTGLDPVIPLEATHYPPIIGIAGSSPAMTTMGSANRNETFVSPGGALLPAT
jgi:hypothetical protein